MSGATIPVRSGEDFDRDRFREYLRESLPDVPNAPLRVEQFPTGASNLTYLVRVGDWCGVLRRPPLGPVPPRTHDMGREGRLLARLHPVFHLAPGPLLICEDPDVIGAPFHVMEYRAGVVIDSRLPEGLEPGWEPRRVIGERVVAALVDLHRVDYRKAGLDRIGRPEGFLERQVAGWVGRYEGAQTERIAEAQPLIEWLTDHVPESPAPTVIHNDFKLNNILFDPHALEISGILDWEMTTIGDPFFDLAVLLCYWVDPDDPPRLRAMLPSVTTQPGFPRRDDLQQMYANWSGRSLSQMPWYLTFAYFKLAVILQQIYARWVRGQTKDPRFGSFGEKVRTLIAHAYARTNPVRAGRQAR
ncbi:MAG: phosphotransferase [Gemmatimonas sp.]|nr:phosphotransferase [Gemmatimonas sp.]